MRVPTFTILSLAAVAAPAAAQSASEATRTVDALGACRAIAEPAPRLACFDGVADRIAVARKSGDLMIVDRKQVVERKRRGFGLAMTSGEVFGGGPEDDATEVKQVDTTIDRIAPASSGRFNMALANGSVWQNIDSLPMAPRDGTAITLKRAPLGGYRASIKGYRPVLVKRVR